MGRFWLVLWLWMGSAVLCNHCLGCAMIYDLDGNNSSALAAALISVVMLWFSDFWSFWSPFVTDSLRAGTYEDAAVTCTPHLFVSLVEVFVMHSPCLYSWRTRQDYFKTPPPETPKYVGDSLLGC
ncbi:hypothetical protein XENOCAPTIV_022331 [Xenoophorus captivus]|uniref:Uncharacterized protein n=1 Tax=Xenoophorus captivus TaxID=1517983 RepID=A0ABV0RLF8_9TELE